MPQTSLDPAPEAAARREKKSEMLQVRLPYSLKLDFMARCAAAGTSASDVVRGLIEDWMAREAGGDRHPAPALVPLQGAPVRSPKVTLMQIVRRSSHMTAAAFVVGLAGLAVLAPPSEATPEGFTALDRNADGVLTAADFPGEFGNRIVEALDTNKDGEVTPDEFGDSSKVIRLDVTDENSQRVEFESGNQRFVMVHRQQVADGETPTEAMPAPFEDEIREALAAPDLGLSPEQVAKATAAVQAALRPSWTGTQREVRVIRTPAPPAPPAPPAVPQD
jgi:hypothetical protein